MEQNQSITSWEIMTYHKLLPRYGWMEWLWHKRKPNVGLMWHFYAPNSWSMVTHTTQSFGFLLVPASDNKSLFVWHTPVCIVYGVLIHMGPQQHSLLAIITSQHHYLWFYCNLYSTWHDIFHFIQLLKADIDHLNNSVSLSTWYNLAGWTV